MSLTALRFGLLCRLCLGISSCCVRSASFCDYTVFSAWCPGRNRNAGGTHATKPPGLPAARVRVLGVSISGIPISSHHQCRAFSMTLLVRLQRGAQTLCERFLAPSSLSLQTLKSVPQTRLRSMTASTTVLGTLHS
jgi:hypothetical protein